jgi:hypothetical protein
VSVGSPPSLLALDDRALGEPPTGYKLFKERQNEVTKVVLKPHGETRH